MTFLKGQKIVGMECVRNDDTMSFVRFWLQGWVTGLSMVGRVEYVRGLQGEPLTLLEVKRERKAAVMAKTA